MLQYVHQLAPNFISLLLGDEQVVCRLNLKLATDGKNIYKSHETEAESCMQ